MNRKLSTRTKSYELLQFISRNPGSNAEQIAKSLGWTLRSVKLLLGRLEKAGKISSRYFPAITTEVESHWSIEREISLEEGKLKRMLLNLRHREKETFEKCVKAQMSKDDNLASMYANQCAEIRKLIKSVAANENLLNRISLALENLRLRRKTT